MGGIDSRCSGRNIELGKDIADVPGGGGASDEQNVGNLSVGQAVREKLKHFRLSGGEANRAKARRCGSTWLAWPIGANFICCLGERDLLGPFPLNANDPGPKCGFGVLKKPPESGLQVGRQLGAQFDVTGESNCCPPNRQTMITTAMRGQCGNLN